MEQERRPVQLPRDGDGETQANAGDIWIVWNCYLYQDTELSL